MKEVTVVSFYTPNNGWPEHGARLRSGCRELGVPHRIQERPDTGSWLGNCRLKPLVLLEAMADLRRPLLWLDVDTWLLRAPEGLDASLDFMGRAKPPGQARRWHVDAMFFNATSSARQLLSNWADAMVDHSDEEAFNRIWEAGTWNGSWGTLSPELYGPHADALVIYGRSRSDRKTTEVAALRAQGR